MAEITYDRLTVGEFENLVTFTDVPNIIKVSDSTEGERANLELEIIDDLSSIVSADTQLYITFLGETITNVVDPQNANGKRFYASQDDESTAFSIGRALRACPKISTSFNITVSGTGITLVAKTIGEKWSNISGVLYTNISTAFMTRTSTSSGSSESDLFGSKIVVDAYTADTSNNYEYVTSFEKILTDKPTSFNVSPFLSTISEYGDTTPYKFDITAIKTDGTIEPIDSFSASSIIGYEANSSSSYTFSDRVKVLANNVGTLYIYDNTLDYSLIYTNTTSYWYEHVKVYNSLDGLIYSSDSLQYRSSANIFKDVSRGIPASAMSLGYYLTLQLNDSEVIRYDIIKPLKTSETVKRVYWRNCYGGRSFFDFVSTQSDSSEVEIETYEKNIFDYYEAQTREKKKIYSNNFEKTFSLTSHLIKEEGKWIFDDMMKSKCLWVMEGNKKNFIIPKSISVEENSTYNGLFTAKFTYTLSYEG